MKRKIVNIVLLATIGCAILSSCGSKKEQNYDNNNNNIVDNNNTSTDNNNNTSTDNNNNTNNNPGSNNNSNNQNNNDNDPNKDPIIPNLPGDEEIPTIDEFTKETMNIYNLAVSDGFDGTYEEWLESIKGDEVILQVEGNVLQWKYKTATEWKVLYDLNTIKGSKGDSAYDIYKQMNPTYAGSEEDWINGLVLGTLISTKGESRVEDDKITNGLEYTLSSDSTYYILTGIGKEITTTEVVVPQEYKGLPVKEVAAYAFNYRNDLVKIVLPSSVTKINDAAFYGCSSLTTFKFGVASIGRDAFYNCNKLTNVYFNGNATDWFKNTYAELTSNPMNYAKNLYINTNDGSIYNANSSLVFDIPSTVTTINDYAFVGMSEVLGVVIPSSVTSIGEAAFNGASSLETITVPFVGRNGKLDDASFGIIFGEDSYTGGISITQKYIKEYDADGAVTDTNTYYIPAKLKNITVKSDDEINAYAFNGLSMIESLYIDAPIADDAEHVFDGCSSLKKIKLTDKVTLITESMFENCASLEKISIPSVATAIAKNAFKNCASLTSVNIPSSVTNIYESAFNGCVKLEKVIINGSLAIHKNAFYLAKIEAIDTNEKAYTLTKYTSKTNLEANTSGTNVTINETNIKALTTDTNYYKITISE